jgi:hypothetical protein
MKKRNQRDNKETKIKEKKIIKNQELARKKLVTMKNNKKNNTFNSKTK